MSHDALLLVDTTPPGLGQTAVLGLLVVGLVLLGRGGWIALDLWVDSLRRHHEASVAHEYAAFYDKPAASFDTHLADAVGLPGDREHSWPGMAPMLDDEPTHYDLHAVLTVAGSLPEHPAETSGRHARVDGDNDTPTGLIPPVVDGPDALAVVAAVSGQDGAA